MNLLEELWYDNIEPTEYAISPSKEYKELLHRLTQNEKTILESMTDAQKEQFFRYTDCVSKFHAMTECSLFQNSFRLGAKIMLEIIDK